MIGPAAGLVIKIGETTVYHAGDTCLFGDMKLIAQRSDVDVALLPIGGHYTMDRRDAVVAAELVGAPTVIPMHYDTFPAIETDAEAFKAEVESKTSSRVAVVSGSSRRVSMTSPESTFGAGQNTVRPIAPARRTSAYQAAFTEGTPYVLEPGAATSRSATSACTMTRPVRSDGRCSSSRSSTGTARAPARAMHAW